jgi:hypothetical protein
MVASIEGDAARERGSSALPRVLFNMFSGRMPVMAMFGVGAQKEAITNEPEFWTYFKPRPARDPAPSEREHWARVKRQWQIRMAHPELKSGTLDFRAVTCDDPAVFGFLRIKRKNASLVVLNFRAEPVTCRVTVNWKMAGLPRPRGPLAPRDLLRDEALPMAAPAAWVRGYDVTLPARDGRVLKLAGRTTP